MVWRVEWSSAQVTIEFEEVQKVGTVSMDYSSKSKPLLFYVFLRKNILKIAERPDLTLFIIHLNHADIMLNARL